MKKMLCILGCVLWGASTNAQTLPRYKPLDETVGAAVKRAEAVLILETPQTINNEKGRRPEGYKTLEETVGAMGIAGALQAALRGEAVNGHPALAMMGGNIPQPARLPSVTTGGNNGGTTTATTRPATTRPVTTTGTTQPATTQPAGGNNGGTTGGNNGSGGQGSTPAGRGGYISRLVNNGYGRQVAGLGGGTSARPVFGGRTLSAPLRPVFARITNMRYARLNLRLGFANLVSAPSAGVGAQ